VQRFLGWFALALGIIAIAFFSLVPGIIERSMNKVEGPAPSIVSPRVAALHKSLQIADMHADTLLWSRDFDVRANQGQVDLPRLEQGNVALQILSSVTKTPKNQNYDSNGSGTDNITSLVVAQGQPIRTWNSLIERSLWHAEKLRRAEAESDGKLRIVRSRADISRLLTDRAAGKNVTGAMLSVEGLHNLEGNFGNLDRLYAAGFRMASLTHFFDNDLAGSMHGLDKYGITPFGLHVMRAMEAKGMIVDIAHASHTTVSDILRLAQRPVVSSHGGVQATCKVNRNLTDNEIKGVARTGGIVGIGYWDAAVCDTSAAGIVRAITHVRNLVGIDHVGLGSDFDGAVTTRFDTTRLDGITQAMVDVGFTDVEIAKVMGGNTLRLLGSALLAK
jgi:membrane dipeptidase